jgi:hypothetical protein
MQMAITWSSPVGHKDERSPTSCQPARQVRRDRRGPWLYTSQIRCSTLEFDGYKRGIKDNRFGKKDIKIRSEIGLPRVPSANHVNDFAALRYGNLGRRRFLLAVRKFEELRFGNARQIRHAFARNTLRNRRMMAEQVISEMIRGIALAGSVTDDDDAVCACQSDRYCLVERDVFWCALSARDELIFVRQMMKEVMWIIRLDGFAGSVRGIGRDVVNLRLVVIDDDHEIRRGRIDMSSRDRMFFRRPTRERKKFSQLDDIGTRDVLLVRLAHEMHFT